MPEMKPVELLTIDELAAEIQKRCRSVVLVLEMPGKTTGFRGLAVIVPTQRDSKAGEEGSPGHLAGAVGLLETGKLLLQEQMRTMLRGPEDDDDD